MAFLSRHNAASRSRITKSFIQRSSRMTEMVAEKELQVPTRESFAAAKSGTEEEWYDLLPVEKKLIGYSLALGVGLLVLFVFAFGVFK